MSPRYNDPYRCDEDDDGDDPRYWDEEFDEDSYGADQDGDLCDHEDYDFDWEGHCICSRCGHSWDMSTEDFKAMAERDRKMHEEFKREAWALWRKEWADRILFWRRWTRKPKTKEIDDEIPF